MFPFLHSDHLSRPQFATNDNGVVTWDGGITTPFGITMAGLGAQTQALMFPGQYEDAETTGAGVTLSHNWHRTYDPTLGRYLQADPIGLAGGLNRYAYVGGNPTGFVDPDGLNPFLVGLALRELGKRFVVGAASGIVLEGLSQLHEADYEVNCLDKNRIFIAGLGGGIGGLFKIKSPIGVGFKNHKFRKRVEKFGNKAFNNPGLKKDIRDIGIQSTQGVIASTIVKKLFAKPFDPCECVKEQKRLKSIPSLRGRSEL